MRSLSLYYKYNIMYKISEPITATADFVEVYYNIYSEPDRPTRKPGVSPLYVLLLFTPYGLLFLVECLNTQVPN